MSLKTRIFVPALLVLVFIVGMTASASATIYYIAANGSDSNNGTSKSSPWLHAPGMPNCTGTCASTVPQPGDQFIFRGGDTWHFSNSGASPSVGGTWKWAWSGANGSPIYIGVDQAWFAGGAWVRPIFTGDNQPTKSFVTSCQYTTPNMVNVSNHNWITVDDFEFTGKCWTSGSGPVSIQHDYSQNVTFENNYFHGWMTCSTCTDNGYAIYGTPGGTSTQTYSTMLQNVFDGSDSYCTGANACTGFSIYGDCTTVRNNVFRYVSNGAVCNNTVEFIGNLVEYVYEPFDPATHGNIMEWLGFQPGTTPPFYIYNNVIRNTNQGETFDVRIASTLYSFNNVFLGVGNAGNCVMQEVSTASVTGVKVYHYNETFDNPCTIRLFGGTTPFNGTTFYKNNHIIGFSTSSISTLYSCNSGAACTDTDNGNEIFQSESTANGQGYVASNNYAPTSSTDATVGAGANNATFCNALPDATAKAACNNGAAPVSYASASHSVIIPKPVPRPSSGAWDVGAYQYGTSSASNPVPPAGLAAAIQ